MLANPHKFKSLHPKLLHTWETIITSFMWGSLAALELPNMKSVSMFTLPKLILPHHGPWLRRPHCRLDIRAHLVPHWIRHQNNNLRVVLVMFFIWVVMKMYVEASAKLPMTRYVMSYTTPPQLSPTPSLLSPFPLLLIFLSNLLFITCNFILICIYLLVFDSEIIFIFHFILNLVIFFVFYCYAILYLVYKFLYKILTYSLILILFFIFLNNIFISVNQPCENNLYNPTYAGNELYVNSIYNNHNHNYNFLDQFSKTSDRDHNFFSHLFYEQSLFISLRCVPPRKNRAFNFLVYIFLSLLPLFLKLSY